MNTKQNLVQTCLLCAVLLQAATSGAQTLTTIVIDSKANIWGAGHASVPIYDGLLPPGSSFIAGAGQVLTFSNVTGLVDFDYGEGLQGPDGATGNANYSSADGISSILDANRAAYLVGVFLDNSEPANPAPPSLDFSDSAIGHSFSSLAPQLRQLFFIGDGLTGTGSGSTQQFIVPPTATRLYLGLADVLYEDNKGSFTATFIITSPAQPQMNLIKAVKPSFNNLTLTSNYQLQVSADMNTWTNQGSPFTATNASMVYPQYWDAANWNSLFFRLQVTP